MERLNRPELSIARKVIGNVKLTNSVKLKVLNAIYEYAEETITMEKQNAQTTKGIK